jgi:hypothetical protein
MTSGRWARGLKAAGEAGDDPNGESNGAANAGNARLALSITTAI